MLHGKNANSVNIDKILDEARSRKPVMELEEIENLLKDKTTRKAAPNKWRNISLIMLILLVSSGIALYLSQTKSEKLTDKTYFIENNKIENQVVIPENKNGFANTENSANKTEKEINTAGVKRDEKELNHPVPYFENERNYEEGKSIIRTDKESDAIFSEPAPRREASTKYSLRGWELGSKAPGQFKYGLDDEVVFTGDASAYISSEKTNYNSAWLTQEISAAAYAGKRLKMSAMVKSSNAGKKAWTGIFMNIKGNDFKLAGYDNMYDKNVSGKSDWVKCELVMDVPKNNKDISFGLYKVYSGDAWIDDIQLEIVGTEIPLHYKTETEATDTSLIKQDIGGELANLLVNEPTNLDFEKLQDTDLPQGWHIGEEKQHFRAMTDKKVYHSKNASVFLQSSGYIEKDWNTLMQYCRAGDFAGKRLKITAWVRTENLKDHAQFIVRANGANTFKNQQTSKEHTFTGNNNWKKVELIIDIPEAATHFTYGLLLTGKGKVWMDDISIEEIPTELTSKNKPDNKLPVNLGFEE